MLCILLVKYILLANENKNLLFLEIHRTTFVFFATIRPFYYIEISFKCISIFTFGKQYYKQLKDTFIFYFYFIFLLFIPIVVRFYFSVASTFVSKSSPTGFFFLLKQVKFQK